MHDFRHMLAVLFTSAAGVTGLGSAATLLSSTADHAQASAQPALATALDQAPVQRRSEQQQPSATYVGLILPEQAVDLAAPQAGKVEELHVALGEVVERDQLLVSLSVDQASLDLARATAEREGARAALARARIEQTHAVEQAERSQQLAAEGLATSEELGQARFKLNESQALRAEAEARLSERTARAEQLAVLRDQTRVLARFHGRVSLRYVSPGTLVAAGTPLVRLISDDAVLLRFAIPEQASDLRVGSRVKFVPNEHSELSFEATVVRVAPEIDSASRMRTLEATPLDGQQIVEQGLVGAIVSVQPSAAGAKVAQP
ncbi:MAG TPA: efflux RND transporter periplasmic adaptor subunit [Polyangiales bacterium]|nr:efflux RND transporter periplasmic adaptor subunit [Polyangiales bacterium]